ncbi:MAG: hypothetical protein AAF705_12500 [Bacteroidota bacterium]
MRLQFSLIILTLFIPFTNQAKTDQDYLLYHQKVIEAESLIVDQSYQAALAVYEKLFEDYDFVFLREYQVASQLAIHLGKGAEALPIVEQGILGGWTLKAMKKNTYLANKWDRKSWKIILERYPILRAQYESQLNQPLKGQLKKMFAKDQRKAFSVFIRLGSKAKEHYAERKFVPHSIEQMRLLNEILLRYGYPGERLIGPNYWTSTVLSHHNSISPDFNQKDLLYPAMKPLLKDALRTGYLAPSEWALIDEWYRICTQTSDQAEYGLIKQALPEEKDHINQLRAALYLRNVELRNQLIDVEQATGMNFYLPKGWVSGKIAANS